MKSRSKPSSALAMVQPLLTSPTRLSCGTRTLSKNTSQNSSCRSRLTIGRTVMPGAVHRHQQEADAVLLLGALVGAHQHEDPVGVVGERGPDLLAVDDEVVAVEHGLGAQRGEVGAGIGLAVALAPDVLAGEDARQMEALLRRRAVADQQRPEHDDAHVAHPRAAVALVLLDQDQMLGRRQAHAAVLARPAGREPAVPRPASCTRALFSFQCSRRGGLRISGRIVRLDEAAHRPRETPRRAARRNRELVLSHRRPPRRVSA